jgi:hypothetical protein
MHTAAVYETPQRKDATKRQRQSYFESTLTSSQFMISSDAVYSTLRWGRGPRNFVHVKEDLQGIVGGYDDMRKGCHRSWMVNRS